MFFLKNFILNLFILFIKVRLFSFETSSSFTDSICIGKRFVAHPDDCTKYIRCDSNGNIFQIYTCPSPTLFNDKLNICDQPSNVKCVINLVTTTTPNITTFVSTTILTSTAARMLIDTVEPVEEIVDQFEESFTTDKKQTTTDTFDRATDTLDSLCKSAGLIIAYPNDCSKFIKCNEDVSALILDCPDGYFFSPKTRLCDLAENVDCDNNDFTTIADTTASANLDIEKSTVEDNNLTELCKVGKMFAKHPNDCTKYIRCNLEGNLLQIVQCPEYLVFNVEISVCEEAYKVDCATGLSITTTTTTTTTSHTTTQTLITDTVAMLSEFCNSNKRLVQHPNDCSKYIVCDANKIAVKIFQCPGLQLFNEEIGICDVAYNVKCKINGNTILTTEMPTTTINYYTADDNIDSCTNDSNNLPTSTKCKKYFSCTPGQTITIMC